MKNNMLNYVDAYINGEDILEYSLDELENNAEFMLEVLKRTDKSMYQFTSEDLKHDYAFITNVIKLFKNDENFVADVVEKALALKNDEYDTAYAEFLITSAEVLLKNDNLNYVDLAIKFSLFNHQNAIIIAALKEDSDVKDIIGEGFLYIQTRYNSDIVNKFYAEKFIERIIYNNNYSIDEFLHANFKTYEELINYGINNCFINNIRMKDDALADYVCCHINLLNEYSQKVESIGLDWNNYEKGLNYQKFEVLEEKIDSLIDDTPKAITTGLHILNKLVDDLSLQKEFNSYLDYLDKCDSDNMVPAKEIYIEPDKDKEALDKLMTFADKKVFEQCKKEAKEIFKSKKIPRLDDDDNYNQVDQDNKNRILKIDFNKYK